ncbi:MAG: hypothetical protein J5864_08105 [Oscillospiraceae bacterium]|nr:hypothetical protein [Oscillospiraceae bacterium]
MKLGITEVKLFYSNWAVRELTELCGGLQNIGRLFNNENGESLDTTTVYMNVIKLVRILANANIIKENSEIALGMREGEKKELIDEETMSNILDMSKASDYLLECLDVMGLASKFEVPDGVKLESADIDLEEIEAEKNP